jgi:hypothetical protein
VEGCNLHLPRGLPAVRIFTPQVVHTFKARKKVAIPLLDPIKDLGIEDKSFKTLMDRAGALTMRLAEHKLSTYFGQEDCLWLVQVFENKKDLEERARVIRVEARSCQTMTMKDALKKMKRV